MSGNCIVQVEECPVFDWLWCSDGSWQWQESTSWSECIKQTIWHTGTQQQFAFGYQSERCILLLGELPVTDTHTHMREQSSLSLMLSASTATKLLSFKLN